MELCKYISILHSISFQLYGEPIDTKGTGAERDAFKSKLKFQIQHEVFR